MNVEKESGDLERPSPSWRAASAAGFAEMRDGFAKFGASFEELLDTSRFFSTVHMLGRSGTRLVGELLCV